MQTVEYSEFLLFDVKYSRLCFMTRRRPVPQPSAVILRHLTMHVRQSWNLAGF